LNQPPPSPHISSIAGWSMSASGVPQNMTFNKSLFLVKKIFCFIIFLQIMEKYILNYLTIVMFCGTPGSLIGTADFWVTGLQRSLTSFTRPVSCESHTNKHISYSLLHISYSKRTKKRSFLFYASLCLLNFKQMSHGIIKQV